jgi:quercetin dioxygenase-like cupin family protein
MRIVPSLILSVLLCSTAAVAHGPAGAGAAPLPVVTPLATQALPDQPGKEVLILEVVYPPGAVEPVHRHDADAFVYVLEGSIVMGVAGSKEVTLTPGQVFHEGPADLHTVGRNVSKDTPARFIAFLVKDTGKPAVIPVD